MNLLILVLVLVLPNTYLAREAGTGDEASSYRDSFVFPEDRKSNPNSRIIGGREVAPHSYPSLAALLIFTQSQVYFCGGSLITDRYVLTAAHCVIARPNPVLYILVRLGAHDISTQEPSAVIFNATEWVYHSGWDESLLQNDIALIKLPSRVNLNNNIQTVRYANGTNSYANVSSTMLGWGETENSALVSDVLRSVNTLIISNELCGAADPALNAILRPTHVCTSGAGFVGTCQGDAGGPLLVDGVQVGIVSFGFANCLTGMPSVFTRVTEFSAWIEENAVL